jgi:hypothetical protein
MTKAGADGIHDAKLPYAGISRIRFQGSVSARDFRGHPRFQAILQHEGRRDASALTRVCMHRGANSRTIGGGSNRVEDHMRYRRWAAGACLCFGFTSAPAQTVIRDEEILASDRPEAWAMNYVSAAGFLTAFGETPVLGAGEWLVAGELGHVPTLSDRQQRVGFGGDKAEDLNKSPVFGRLRATLGLPAGWIAELGYTPPLTIDGTRTHDLFALAIGRRLVERDAWSVSARVFGQHGSATGDITCPEQVVGPFDPEDNPFGCVAASHDRIALNHYGVDATWARASGAWRWHATAGVVRNEPTVQVDALVFSVRDRSHLVARGVLPYLAFGANRALGPQWTLGAEWLYVPLDVRREADRGSGNDAFSGLRLRLAWSPH